jgi:SAM-dependent methyltransferase
MDRGQLERREVAHSRRFLDLGCGSGRLTLPLATHLAERGGRVVGVDVLPEAVDLARAHARELGVSNVTFSHADALEFLRGEEPGSYAAALLLEVSLFVTDLSAVLLELARVLRPGGLLLANFRPQYFLALVGVNRRDWELTRTVLERRSGALAGIGWQNWHTSSDVVATLRAAGFSGVELLGLGLCSGIDGDPLAPLARPSQLGSLDLRELATVERTLGRSHPDIGRYLLASAVATSAPAADPLPRV